MIFGYAVMCPVWWTALMKVRLIRNRWSKSPNVCWIWAAMKCRWVKPLVATPDRVQKVWDACLAQIDTKVLAGHFHNTYGMAIANIYQSLLQGIRVFDSSIAGLGGCPYAKGASGNVSTEDLYYLLSNMGF